MQLIYYIKFIVCPCGVLQKDEVYLNLVLDFIPETVYRVIRHHSKAKQIMPLLYIKVCLCCPSSIDSVCCLLTYDLLIMCLPFGIESKQDMYIIMVQ